MLATPWRSTTYLHVVDIRDRARVGDNTNCLKITVRSRSTMTCIARHTDEGKKRGVLEENRKDKKGALHFTPKMSQISCEMQTDL